MNLESNQPVVVAYGRSAVAKSGKKGALRQTHPVTIGGLTLKGVLEKVPQLDPAQVNDLIVGCAIPERKQGFNMARLVAARAGLPDSVCGMTINRFCSSGLQAIALAAAQIQCGMADVIVAGGVESMTACPVNLDISDTFDPELLAMRPEEYLPMGLTAENVAARYGVTREEMDQLAVESHRRAAAAQDAGKFDEEIIPLPGVDEAGEPIVFCKDQGIRRDTSLEKLAAMKPCFKEGGVVTAATSSQTSDAAAFVVVMSAKKAQDLGIKPIATLEGFAVAGCQPDYMGLGPIYAAPKALAKAGITVADLDVVELNEAFAAQAIPCMKELGLDPAKTNPNGGAMALGHPQGATGAFLTCKLLCELRRTGGTYGMVTMCIGGGMGAAGIYKICR
jgi:acetyl-CoA acyltransferase